jgi:hypothetical protein
LEKEKDSCFIYLNKESNGARMTLRLDINKEAQEITPEDEEIDEEEEYSDRDENESQSDVAIEADLYLHPKKGDGILFTFEVTSKGDLQILSLNHLPPNLVFPEDPTNDLQNAQRFAGVAFEQLDENLQEQLHNHFTQNYVDSDMGLLLHDIYFNEENKEYRQTLVALKNFVEQH